MGGRRLKTDADIDDLLGRTRRIAVLGIQTVAQWDRPAFTGAVAHVNVSASGGGGGGGLVIVTTGTPTMVCE